MSRVLLPLVPQSFCKDSCRYSSAPPYFRGRFGQVLESRGGRTDTTPFGGSHGSCARLMLARRPAVSFAHKEKLSYEQRCYESTRVREKYSDRFPVIVERDSNSDVPAIDKCAQTPRMQDATHTLTIRCMHILQTRAGHTLPTPARCYPQAIHANPLTHPQVQVPDPARHDDGPAGVRAAQADLRARGAGDLRVRRKHATTRERAGQQRGVLPHLSPV